MLELGHVCFSFQVAFTSQKPEIKRNISFEKLASKKVNLKLKSLLRIALLAFVVVRS